MNLQRLRRFVLLALTAAAPGVCLAQPQLGTNEVVFKSGNWFVVRSTRSRSSAIGCTGFYKSERDVQLSQDSLIIKVDGDLRQIVVRYDDELSQPGRPPTRAERQLGAIVLSGPNFEALHRSRKLAIEVTTQQGRSGHVLRLQGLAQALESIKAGCPVPAEAVVLCSDPLQERMKANGVSEAQMAAICR